MDYDDLKGQIDRDGANLRCEGLKKILESAGFNVKKGNNGNHYTITHDDLEGFTATSFNGGHGRNPQVNPFYIKRIKKIITKYKEELKAFLEKKL